MEGGPGANSAIANEGASQSPARGGLLKENSQQKLPVIGGGRVSGPGSDKPLPTRGNSKYLSKAHISGAERDLAFIKQLRQKEEKFWRQYVRNKKRDEGPGGVEWEDGTVPKILNAEKTFVSGMVSITRGSVEAVPTDESSTPIQSTRIPEDGPLVPGSPVPARGRSKSPTPPPGRNLQLTTPPAPGRGPSSDALRLPTIANGGGGGYSNGRPGLRSNPGDDADGPLTPMDEAGPGKQSGSGFRPYQARGLAGASFRGAAKDLSPNGYQRRGRPEAVYQGREGPAPRPVLDGQAGRGGMDALPELSPGGKRPAGRETMLRNKNTITDPGMAGRVSMGQIGIDPAERPSFLRALNWKLERQIAELKAELKNG